MSQPTGIRRPGRRVWAMVGSDGNIGIAPAISLGVQSKGDRECLAVLMGGSHGIFHEIWYDLRAAVHEKVCLPDPDTEATVNAQPLWEVIEAELMRLNEKL